VNHCGSSALILGANGQLGRALRRLLPQADFASRAEIDVRDPRLDSSRDWGRYDTVINAAAYTNVDHAETAEGRREAWATNAQGVASLVRVAARNDIALVHVSTDYVFDGSVDLHPEDEPFSPLSVYGQTKAAGDAIVSTLDRHYIIRTSWVIGDGSNFVRTMASLAARGIATDVVDDQIGRLSFTSTVSEGILHLLKTGAPFGTYNLTNSGTAMSWAAIARRVYELVGRDPAGITGISTATYFDGKDAAPGPLLSGLALDRIRGLGYNPRDHMDQLAHYLSTDRNAAK
jgi:dTDP-4-dehydrorhamnose reductase